MARAILLIALMPAWAIADPLFKPIRLENPHVYSGGWEHFVGGGVAVFDCNGDRLPDFVAAGGKNPAALYVNKSEVGGDVSFNQSEFQNVQGATGMYPLDFDNDGVLDLAILRVGPNKLLKGVGDCQFSDVTAFYTFGALDRWSTAFSATWEEGAVWPTFAVGNYVDRSDLEGPFEACDVNELHRVNLSKKYEILELDPGYCALSMLFSDWRRSGVQDLRISHDRHYYVSGGSEQMWAMPELVLRDGDGFKPISIWGMGIASQDITGDGRPEVVLTSMGDQLMQIAGPNGYSAARYEIGTYAHKPYTGGDGRPSTGWHAQFADVNNDGLDDLFIAKGNVDQMPGMATRDPNNLLMQNENNTFSEKGDVAGIASLKRGRGAGLADLNGDGLLDLIVVNRRAALELYQNVTPRAGNWLTVSLHQNGVNTRAVGAWVELRLNNRMIAREITVGGGHVSGQSVPLHYGLGTASKAEVRIIWPDGIETEWHEFAAGQNHQITR